MKTKYLVVCVIFILTLVITQCYNWRSRIFINEIAYDLFHSNPSITTKKDLDTLLESFERIQFNAMPKEYLKKSKMSDPEYSKLVRDMRFYKINPMDRYKKVVGDFRVNEFIAKDNIYRNRSSEKLFWGIKPEILYKLLELKDAFKEEDLNWGEIRISSGHRTPYRNEVIGGASKSRHIVGEAIDLKIGDVDGNGYYDERDKSKVLKICEERIIGNKGGIGKYPGTRIIHIDVRGYKARWDTY